MHDTTVNDLMKDPVNDMTGNDLTKDLMNDVTANDPMRGNSTNTRLCGQVTFTGHSPEKN